MMSLWPLPFIKMQALGNDFVVIDGCEHPFDLSKSEIRLLADRHRGVGCDQVLLIQPSDEPAIADVIYRIFNQNGSEVSQCGNGARCVARYLADRHRCAHEMVRLKTQVGVIEAIIDPNAKDGSVTLNIGAPQAEQDIPFSMAHVTHVTSTQYQLNDVADIPPFAVVDVGNPHVVIYCKSSIETQPLSRWGERLNQHPAFPEGVNVSVMTLQSLSHSQGQHWPGQMEQQILLRVYERGVGETLACGSAACAAVVAAKRDEQLPSGRDPVVVKQPGGSLRVVWSGASSSPIFMTGPTQEVFEGRWYRPEGVSGSLRQAASSSQ